MSDEEPANGTVKWTWMKPIIAERDAAYANGYTDAETEISKSALGQKNDFLHSQYANAVEQIKDLNELLDDALAEWRKYSIAWMTAEGKLADAEAMIEAQAKDHASNNTRFAEAEHRAKTAEAERDRLRVSNMQMLGDIAVAMGRIEQLAANLKSLVEICEITRDTSGFYKKAQAHQITPQQWSSWCKQIKTARAALKGESHE